MEVLRKFVAWSFHFPFPDTRLHEGYQKEIYQGQS